MMACTIVRAATLDNSSSPVWSPLYGAGSKLDTEAINFIHRIYCRECRMEAAKRDQEKQQQQPGGAEPPSPQVDEAPIQPVMDRNKESLKRKLMLRRSVNELVDQGIYPPLKTPPAFAEQRKQLERAKTGDLLRHKIQSRPDRQALVQQHILEDTNVHPSLQEKQRLLKRARLQDSLSDRLASRPGPLELVERNILQGEQNLVETIKDGTISYSRTCEGEDPKRTIKQFVFDDDSNNSEGAVSPQQPSVDDSDQSNSTSLTAGSSSTSPGIIRVVNVPSSTDVGHFVQQVQQATTSTNFTFANKIQPITTQSFTMSQPSTSTTLVTSSKHSSSSSSSKSNRIKKPKPKSTPKSKVIKFHEYKGPPNVVKTQHVAAIAPTPPPPPVAPSVQQLTNNNSDTPYHILLQQQQMFLQFQLECQQKNLPFILPAQKAAAEAQAAIAGAAVASATSIISATAAAQATTSMPPPVSTPAPLLASVSNSGSSTLNSSLMSPTNSGNSSSGSSGNNVATTGQSSSSANPQPATKTVINLEEMKVADLKAELKKRNLTVSGPKPVLIERLRPHVEAEIAANESKERRRTQSQTSIGSVNSDTSLMSPPSVGSIINPVTPSSTSQFDDSINMGSPPISPSNSNSELNTSMSLPMSPDSMDISAPTTFNLGGHPLIRGQFTGSFNCVPMDQLSRPPSVAPMDTMEVDIVQAVVQSAPPAPPPPPPPPPPPTPPKVLQASSPQSVYQAPSPQPILPAPSPQTIRQSVASPQTALQSGPAVVQNSQTAQIFCSVPSPPAAVFQQIGSPPSNNNATHTIYQQVSSPQQSNNAGTTLFQVSSPGQNTIYQQVSSPPTNSLFQQINTSQSQGNSTILHQQVASPQHNGVVQTVYRQISSPPVQSNVVGQQQAAAVLQQIAASPQHIATHQQQQQGSAGVHTVFQQIGSPPQQVASPQQQQPQNKAKVARVYHKQMSTGPVQTSGTDPSVQLTVATSPDAGLLPQAPSPQTVENMIAQVQHTQNLLQQTAPVQPSSSSSSGLSGPPVVPLHMIMSHNDLVRQQQKQIEELQKMLQQSQLRLKEAQRLHELSRQEEAKKQQDKMAAAAQEQTAISAVSTTSLLPQPITAQSAAPQMPQQQLILQAHQIKQEVDPMDGCDHGNGGVPQQTVTKQQVQQQQPVMQTHIQIQSIQQQLQLQQQLQQQQQQLQKQQQQQQQADVKTVVTSSGETVRDVKPLLASLIQSQKLNQSLNLGMPKVFQFAKAPPNGQPFVFTSKPEQLNNNKQQKLNIITISNKQQQQQQQLQNQQQQEVHKASSVPTSPVGNKVASTSSNNIFFSNVPRKEPPKYDEAIKNKQNLLLQQSISEGSGRPGLPSTKCQAMDDLLEILIRNGELPPSAAQEPPPTPKTTQNSKTSATDITTTTFSSPKTSSSSSSSSASLSSSTVSSSPSPSSSSSSVLQSSGIFASSSSSQIFTAPPAYTSTVSLVNGGIFMDMKVENMDVKLTAPVAGKKVPPPPINITPAISSIPSFITTDLSNSFSDSNMGDLPFIAMDWSDTDTALDLNDGLDHGKALSPHDLLNVNGSSPSHNDSSSIHGSEPNLNSLGLGQDMLDANDNPSAMNLDVSDWLDVIMPSTGLTPLSANAPVSFPSDPILTPKPQDVLDLFNMDESDLYTPTDIQNGIIFDKFGDS